MTEGIGPVPHPRNLADLVTAAAHTHPDKVALVFHGRRTSWAELDRSVDRLAAGLCGQGLGSGDRVALAIGNTPEFVAAYFAVLRAGLVAVPVNTAYTVTEVAHLLGDAGVSLAICGRDLAETVIAAGAGIEGLRVVVDDADPPVGTISLADLADAQHDSGPGSAAGAEDLAMLLYTSGTTGRPKGAMLSHRALLANLDQLAAVAPPVVTADDIVLLVLPLFHIYGLNAGLGLVARAGATGVLVERFDPVDTLEEIRREGVTNVIGAPPMYVAWSMLPEAGRAFETVRLAVSGAAPLPPSVLRAVVDATGRYVHEGYGLTETAPVLTSTLVSEQAKAGSVGRPVPGVALRLLDEDGDEVEDGDPGEIVVRGANLFSGYWPAGEDGPDENGWFHTGDVAYADGDGDLFLVDRRRELILVSGFNVYPREVEDVLVRHPDIEEAAVIGIPHPYTGESVKALIVVRSGARLTAEVVIDHAARSLARFKCPTAVQFVDALPHSATGKVAKGRLRETA
ncbi:MAG TPA: AMP-binding protein [Mycobacteriales bacterium]|nr:AMP-binding protein [Mycobacteriales bacterium]